MSAKKKSTAKVSVSYAQCQIFTTTPMRCPLCGAMTVANTWHTCSKEQR